MPEMPNGDGLSKELEHQRKFWKKNLLWTGIAFVLIAVYFFFSSPAIQIVCGDEAVTVTAPDKTVTQLSYSEITDVQLKNKPDYGTLVSGLSKKGYGCGAWKNSDWGTYNRCSYDKTGCCVVVTTADGVTAINQQSADDTTALYEAIRAKLP
jgi:hypothetical protein